MTRPLVLAFALLLLAPVAPVTAQGDGPWLHVLHDVPEDGRTYVGNLNHFGWLLLDDQGQPWVHHDATATVTLNGAVLYKGSPSTGHDYDGVHELALSFPEPGTYTVTVQVPTDDGELVDTFTGTVYDTPLEEAHLDLQVPEQATAGQPVDITYAVRDGSGAIIPHSDVVLRALDSDGRETLRLHTHTHEDPQTLSLALPAAGTYTLEATVYQAFPSENARAFAPTVATQPITVAEAPGARVMQGVPTEQPLTNRVDPGQSEGACQLYATYDPYTSVAPWGRMRLGAVVLDTAGQPIPHVDFTATLTGPQGNVLLESNSLHEYDGAFEMFWSSPQVGDYTLELTAERAGCQGSTTHTFSVVPPAAATAAGPQFAELRGGEDLEAGSPADLELFLHNGAMVPFMHGEVDLTVRDETTGLPVLVDKLHTHDSGAYPFTLTFPTAGTYTLELDPTPTVPAPVPAYYGAQPGQPATFTVEVAPGPGLPGPTVDAPVEPSGEQDPETVPGPGLALVVSLGLLGALLAARRRR